MHPNSNKCDIEMAHMMVRLSVNIFVWLEFTTDKDDMTLFAICSILKLAYCVIITTSICIKLIQSDSNMLLLFVATDFKEFEGKLYTNKFVSINIKSVLPDLQSTEWVNYKVKF